MGDSYLVPTFGLKSFLFEHPLQQCKTAWVEVHSVLVCKDGSVLIHCVVPCRPVAAIGAEILRGRRPPSVQWSSVKAQDAKKTIPDAQSFQGSTSPATRVAKECSPGPLPEEVMSAVQAAVVRLEKALGALDDTDVAATQALQSALERAKGAHQGGRVFCRTGREGVGERRRQAEDALKEARAQRVRHQEELEASQTRLEKLRADSSPSFSSTSHSLHGGVSENGAQIIGLQQMVNQLQAERYAFAERLQQQDCGAEPFGKLVPGHERSCVSRQRPRHQQVGRVISPRSN